MWRRLLVDTLGAVGLAAALALSTLILSRSILAAALDSSGIVEISVASHSDFSAFAIGLALAATLPPIVAWCVALVGRYFERAAPTGPRVALYLAVAFLAAGGGFASQVWRMRQVVSAMRDAQADLAPTITLDSLGLASAAASACLAAGPIMAVLVAWRARAATRP